MYVCFMAKHFQVLPPGQWPPGSIEGRGHQNPVILPTPCSPSALGEGATLCPLCPNQHLMTVSKDPNC